MRALYEPLAFGNEFIKLAGPNGCEHMKLQKLVFLAHGWWLAFHSDAALNEEPQVWTHGPVFKTMYHALKHHGRSPIRYTEKRQPFAPAPLISDGDAEATECINWVWGRYGKHDAFYLSDLTHKQGSPWEQVARQHNFRVQHDTSIPNELIKNYYIAEAKAEGII